jgi:hypothetical protein
VADELAGYDRNRAMAKVEGIYRTLARCSWWPGAGNLDREGRRRGGAGRIDRVSRLRRYWVPGVPTAGPRAVW